MMTTTAYTTTTEVILRCDNDGDNNLTDRDEENNGNDRVDNENQDETTVAGRHEVDEDDETKRTMRKMAMTPK